MSEEPPTWPKLIAILIIATILISSCNFSFAAEKNTISGKFKPSGVYDGGYSYTWHYGSFINYCPNCHHYNTLGIWKHCPERQISCYNCDSDYSGVTGYEKMNPPRSKLIKATIHKKSVSAKIAHTQKKPLTPKEVLILKWKQYLKNKHEAFT
jgi:hypothetical protein